MPDTASTVCIFRQPWAFWPELLGQAAHDQQRLGARPTISSRRECRQALESGESADGGS